MQLQCFSYDFVTFPLIEAMEFELDSTIVLKILDILTRKFIKILSNENLYSKSIVAAIKSEYWEVLEHLLMLKGSYTFNIQCCFNFNQEAQQLAR